jgi:hypothetical protein
MADILTMIQQLKTKGKQMNDNLGSFANTNKQFRDTLLENLKKIQEAISKLNFQDFGANKQALLQANKELEASRLQLQEKQQQLAQVTQLLEESRKETEAANKTLQETSAQMQDLDKKNREALEQMQQEQQKALDEAKNSSSQEQQALRQGFDQQRQELQGEFDKQRATLEEEKNKAQLAAQEATQKMAQIEATHAEIQSGLNDINTLLDNQLQMIDRVINTDPSVGDLNNLVDAIQANLIAGINMLSETKQVSGPQRGFNLPPTFNEFRNMPNQQAKQDFYKISQNAGNDLNVLIKQGEQTGDMTPAETLYQDLLRKYNERYGRASKGGRRRTRRRQLPRKTVTSKQKGGYTYGKEAPSLKKSSAIISVGTIRTPSLKSTTETKRYFKKGRGITRQTKRRRI